MKCRFLVGGVWLLVGGVGPALAEPAAPRPEAEAYAMAWRELNGLLGEERYDAVVAGVEQYLRQYPVDSAYQRRIVGLVGAVFGQSCRETPALRALAQRILKDHLADANYYALGADRLAYSYLFPSDPKLVDYRQAEQVAGQALELLGDRFNPELVYARQVLIWRIHGLYGQQRYAEALAAAKEAVARAPLILEERYFLRWVHHACRYGQLPDTLLPSAKLYWALCDYDQKWVDEGLDLVAQALTISGGPGLGLQFARAQQAAGGVNPLRTVKLLDLGDAATLLAAAGENQQARFDVLLYQGDLAGALALAKAQLQQSAGNQGLLAQALRNLARCFKAHDCSVLRANAFARFHATGEGDNPLPALEAEVAGTSPAVAP